MLLFSSLTMAKLLDGKALGLRIREKIKSRIETLPSQPGLGVILVGNDPASHLYVSLKQRACEEAGIHFEVFLYPSSTLEEDLIEKVHELNARTDINGILVQLPLPSQSADRVIAVIDPLKDVDGFHPKNLERLRRGEPCIASAVALGVMRLIREAVGEGALPPNALIVSSPLFAEPLKLLLQEGGVATDVTPAEDSELASKTRSADILIVAEGMPKLITGDMVKPGAIMIDVGTTRIDEGLVGDIDFDSVEPIVSAITPVPGGVGPMTVAMLLVNILKAYTLQQQD
ncbi:bifunctional 5,10-methylene-tetrahydrofolate dehydrogenase/5,10-methylene-tetrahydrofolate cyclohydrolase [Candidatus Uhrbacteria bacterium CG10_big_fil_rev_8_21_14_0_10_48_16]|uniref:Bifunctional protein FolD n=1 Tax=Candidatus Uhrbacteria bacterium CG10_big_fil_rev_8_21_14_0_10_48_16 TaxID=1975038 RepID=A0A2M8LGF2_9BACT|nr:MAG: bifunctional 5,10-methylene-tetrahydrofolate dehydrogenase/5,10-methylene-tetrahydrofolate cyclohydrolase [Candidatus Uhrbacteria bacterium CG10_big_fil_rev_8_21_14_0_10_48_16]